jgi:hypothetical protein
VKELARPPNEPPSRIVTPRDGNYLHGLRTIEAAAQRRQAAAVRRELRRLLGVQR